VHERRLRRSALVEEGRRVLAALMPVAAEEEPAVPGEVQPMAESTTLVAHEPEGVAA
jgi:hypothetical protein